MPAEIDLHTHSYLSDGTLSPRQVIELAAKNHIGVIALTDHDCIEGIDEAQQAADEYQVQLVPGIEISARYKDGKTLHILGLGIDLYNPEFAEAYQRIKKNRDASIDKIIARLNEQGVYLKEKGLDGLERFYPSFSPTETAYADELIAEFDLLSSGGTDFHGSNRTGIELGTGDGSFGVPYCVYEAIREALNSPQSCRK